MFFKLTKTFFKQRLIKNVKKTFVKHACFLKTVQKSVKKNVCFENVFQKKMFSMKKMCEDARVQKACQTWCEKEKFFQKRVF